VARCSQLRSTYPEGRYDSKTSMQLRICRTVLRAIIDHLLRPHQSGGNTSHQGVQVRRLPYWVKLVRSGSTFSSYSSYNGITWTQIGASQTSRWHRTSISVLARVQSVQHDSRHGQFDNVRYLSRSSAPVIPAVLQPWITGEQVVITALVSGITGGALVALNMSRHDQFVEAHVNHHYEFFWSNLSYLVVSVAPA